jgi:hypothetical protein
VPSQLQLVYLLSCGALGFVSQVDDAGPLSCPFALSVLAAQVCMTIGMQRSKAASGALFRQSGVVYTFAYELLLVPSEHIALATYIGAVVITLSVASLGYWQVSSPHPTARCLL